VKVKAFTTPELSVRWLSPINVITSGSFAAMGARPGFAFGTLKHGDDEAITSEPPEEQA
jgi:hypothetical protein